MFANFFILFLGTQKPTKNECNSPSFLSAFLFFILWKTPKTKDRKTEDDDGNEDDDDDDDDDDVGSVVAVMMTTTVTVWL